MSEAIKINIQFILFLQSERKRRKLKENCILQSKINHHLHYYFVHSCHHKYFTEIKNEKAKTIYVLSITEDDMIKHHIKSISCANRKNLKVFSCITEKHLNVKFSLKHFMEMSLFASVSNTSDDEIFSSLMH